MSPCGREFLHTQVLGRPTLLRLRQPPSERGKRCSISIAIPRIISCVRQYPQRYRACSAPLEVPHVSLGNHGCRCLAVVPRRLAPFARQSYQRAEVPPERPRSRRSTLSGFRGDTRPGLSESAARSVDSEVGSPADDQLKAPVREVHVRAVVRAGTGRKVERAGRCPRESALSGPRPETAPRLGRTRPLPRVVFPHRLLHGLAAREEVRRRGPVELRGPVVWIG